MQLYHGQKLFLLYHVNCFIVFETVVIIFICPADAICQNLCTINWQKRPLWRPLQVLYVH